MLIVLEGCDGTGKTYLGERLTKAIFAKNPHDDVKLIHRGVPEHDNMYVEYDLDFYAPGEGKHVVLDRWHMGEWVYGRLYRGHSQLGMTGVELISQRLIRRGALRLIIDANEMTVRFRLAAKKEDYLKPEHESRVLREYRMLAQQFGWIITDSNEDVDVLIDWAQSLEEQAVSAW